MTAGNLQMASLATRLICLLAGILAASAASQAIPVRSPETFQRDSYSQSASTTRQDTDVDQATRLMQQGKNDEALQILENIAQAEPSRRGIVREIGIANYRKGEYLKAAASFKKAIEEAPNDNEAIQLMGISYYLAGRPADAI